MLIEVGKKYYGRLASVLTQGGLPFAWRDEDVKNQVCFKRTSGILP